MLLKESGVTIAMPIIPCSVFISLAIPLNAMFFTLESSQTKIYQDSTAPKLRYQYERQFDLCGR
jgi:hypothetical protein